MVTTMNQLTADNLSSRVHFPYGAGTLLGGPTEPPAGKPSGGARTVAGATRDLQARQVLSGWLLRCDCDGCCCSGCKGARAAARFCPARFCSQSSTHGKLHKQVSSSNAATSASMCNQERRMSTTCPLKAKQTTLALLETRNNYCTCGIDHTPRALPS